MSGPLFRSKILPDFLYPRGVQMRTLKVFVKAENGKIACMCLRCRKRCKELSCELDTVLHDEYKQYRECFRNKRPPGIKPN